VFEVKKVALMDVLPLCVSFCGFVVLTNLSLEYNTVGFYQVCSIVLRPIGLAFAVLWLR
jgi:solute carrier family 35 protein E3